MYVTKINSNNHNLRHFDQPAVVLMLSSLAGSIIGAFAEKNRPKKQFQAMALGGALAAAVSMVTLFFLNKAER